MCNINTIANPLMTFFQYRINRRRIYQHIISYTCNIDNFGGKWAVWITETFKTINDLPILHLDTSKFNNSVIYRRKTSCFHVKYDLCTIIQRNILCSITNWYTIKYNVSHFSITYLFYLLLL